VAGVAVVAVGRGGGVLVIFVRQTFILSPPDLLPFGITLKPERGSIRLMSL
jgi:hypothetical protein